jgi:hypothetical protein
MAIRRFREHVTDHNWFAVGIDFAIVVVGVFLGLQANNWNAARLERAAVRDYRAEVIQNLRANEISIGDQVKYYRQVHDHANAALRVLETPGSAMDEKFLVDIYQATQVRQRFLAHTAYDEMKSAGLGRMIAGPEIRARLASYYAQLPQINESALAVTAYRDRVRRAMPHTIQRQLRERCGDVISVLAAGVVGSALPERCALGLSPSEVDRAAARIRATPDLNQDLTRRIADVEQRLNSLELLRNRAHDLRLLLEKVERS